MLAVGGYHPSEPNRFKNRQFLSPRWECEAVLADVGADSAGSWFVPDSPLEGDGFELSIPQGISLFGAVDRLLGKGAVFGACNLALHGLSKQLAGNAGVSADDAAKEWAANLVPGITLLPSGVWGLNRAQEGGCTYCSGGG